MTDLVKLDEGFHVRRMKESGGLFKAKKLGSAFYIMRDMKDEFIGRHLAVVVEDLSERVDANGS